MLTDVGMLQKKIFYKKTKRDHLKQTALYIRLPANSLHAPQHNSQIHEHL